MRIRWAARTSAIVGGFAVSALFAYLAVRHVDWMRFRASIEHCNGWWLVPAFAVLAAGIFLRALRWRLLFPAQARPPIPAVTRALLVGTFFNNVLPGRPGEALRVITLYQETRTSRAAALGTAVSERVYDVVTLLVLFFVALPWLPELTWLRRIGVFAGIVAILFIVLVAALARWEERPVSYVLARIPGFSNRHEEVARDLVSGLVAMRTARIAIPALAMSFAAIGVITVSFWLVTLAFHLHVGLGAGLLAMVATNLAMVIPSSPAALGVFEAATVVALHPYGIDRSDALSYAVVLHALNSIPFILVGLVLLPHHGLRALRERRSEVAA
ncbi:MAG TPA: lysylphosphatidylglycerol synthase transmembrane domain-containing protein [Gaiellaceae bacterium]|nr:lysylphosphatidylglycerol synthase transmembrane domain-containing protein [Gaiellaceae bacterium]